MSFHPPIGFACDVFRLKKQARGLDVLPTTISKFRKNGDACTANLLESVVYPEEISHCAAGIKWFRYLCLRTPGINTSEAFIPSSMNHKDLARKDEYADVGAGQHAYQTIESSKVLDVKEHDDAVIQTFHATVRRYFRGVLKPPFNIEARIRAGFTPDWYEPLAVKG